MKIRSTFAGIVAAALTASSADAVTIIVGGGSNPGDNVLFNAPGLDGTGTTVEGAIGSFIIDFTSTTSLRTPAQGQARITAQTNNQTFSNLLIDPEGDATFTALQFNVDATEDGFIQFQINGANFGNSYELDGSGQNRFTFLAQGNESFSTIGFTTNSAPVADVLQVRLGGLANPTTPPNDVPEGGATVALLGLGLIGLAAARRKLA